MIWKKDFRTITAREVVDICKKDGLILNLTEAQVVLDFMYKFSKLTLEVLLKDENCETRSALVPKRNRPKAIFKER
jgi:hypothetical protein